jgi:hypothetical protein
MSAKRRPRVAEGPTLTRAEMAFLVDEPCPPDADGLEFWALRFHRDPQPGDTLMSEFGREARPLLRELWSAFGPAVTAAFATAYPGTRPSLWWRYSAPSAIRRRVDPTDPPTREEQTACLRRHGLLTAAELREAP